MMKKRSLVMFMLFSVITLGIYGFYWIHLLAKDINTLCRGDGKKTSGLRAFLLLGIITLGIYDLIWWYMLGDRLQDTAPKYNLSFKESGGAIVLWSVLGSIIIVGPIISLYIVIKNTNALIEAYNAQQPEAVSTAGQA
ncbi:MAG: DUF4234 domain-containing protein [Spirochaetaceae bacterium]|nr:DUF4234 domain-containing protein [Spirochaetaceae bacterium]